ncbi:MAG: hypothetical protein JNL62_15070 [Bryobacterales bacterium]|nr:hypothetical protein [Bryobacterales bacterium]
MFTKLLLTLAAGLAVTTLARAERAEANIPFEFSVGKSVLPPGTYSFDTNVAPGVLRVRSEDWKSAVMIITFGASARNGEERKIVFHRYGDTYFLSKVLYSGGAGCELQKSPREKEMAANRGQREAAGCEVRCGNGRPDGMGVAAPPIRLSCCS